MGGGSSSSSLISGCCNPPPNPPCPPPPNFMQNLISWLNAVYPNPPIPYTGNSGIDMQNLQKNLYNYTTVTFLNQFNYAYLAQATSPPRCSDTSLLYASADLANCSSSNPTGITTYVQALMSNTNLPQAAKGKATSDLATVVNTYLQGLTAGWTSSKYHRQYPGDQQGGPTWVLDAIFTWTCVNVVDYTAQNPVAQPYLFLTFVGVTYPVGAAHLNSDGLALMNSPTHHLLLWSSDHQDADQVTTSGGAQQGGQGGQGGQGSTSTLPRR